MLCLLAIPAGGAEVRSRSGVRAHVAPSARKPLQCVIDFVEHRGIHIKAMRGYGAGTVSGSLHPSGRALDINQLARDVTRPLVSRKVANGAGAACGVISGGIWHDSDVGHWNLGRHERSRRVEAQAR